MADPNHVPELDGFDRLTVTLYRLGISGAAVALLLFPAVEGLSAADLSLPTWLPHAAVLVTTALAVADLHLYDKRIRWVVGVAAWTGAAMSFLGIALAGTVGHWVATAGLGFLFVALSALALKEQFCFKIWGLRGVPALLATSLAPMLAGYPAVAAILLGVAGLIVGALAVAKWRMPLHFDIGNKAAYQI
ncbi:MAG: hypothetical protein KTR31_06590 [Myxococcales bacterium]|nr:hypothetical protein [Myxococcales bacterium]